MARTVLRNIGICIYCGSLAKPQQARYAHPGPGSLASTFKVKVEWSFDGAGFFISHTEHLADLRSLERFSKKYHLFEMVRNRLL